MMEMNSLADAANDKTETRYMIAANGEVQGKARESLHQVARMIRRRRRWNKENRQYHDHVEVEYELIVIER